MDADDCGWGAGPRVWTVDPDRVVAAARATARPSGVSAERSARGVRVLDLVAGLVIDAIPHRTGRWLVRAWVVSEPSTSQVLAPGQPLAYVGASACCVDDEASSWFALAAEVVVAERRDADVVLLVRPDRDGAGGRTGWTPQGANPGGLVLTRIVQAARERAR